MGAGPSKPAQADVQHVFTRETPVRLSPNLVDSLELSPESDSTRSKDLELHIQSRVEAELKRLDEETSKTLKELQESISAAPDATTETVDGTAQSHISDQLASLVGKDAQAKREDGGSKDLSRASVQKEIDTLKEKLKRRQMKEDVVNDKEVNKAKEEVVRCLRVNDRRPLDCWKEVETFRREVGRLEGAFLGRVLE
ncbi:hypothetical protein ACLMJK_001059 [Lecanora helva]